MREMDAETLKTRVQLRLSEHHRKREGDSDMDIGYRLGILTALNIVSQVSDDLEAEARLAAEDV